MKISKKEGSDLDKSNNIIKLANELQKEEFLKSLDKYEDYLLTRYAKALRNGDVAAEICHFRKGDVTEVVCVEVDSLGPVFEKGIEDSLNANDSAKAAKYMFLKKKLNERKNS